MSLAHDYSRFGSPTVGNTAPQLPSYYDEAPRHSRRVAPAHKAKVAPKVMTFAVIWLLVMAFSLFSVYRNTVLQQELRGITSSREELANLQLQNRELQDKLVTSVSVDTIQKWAIAHGMSRSENVKPLKDDPLAVAPRPEPAAVAVTTPATPAATGFLGSVQTYLARIVRGFESAKP
ncbi:MAG: hypothetical protein ACM3XM_08005 [Mycobacterium leprae]